MAKKAEEPTVPVTALVSVRQSRQSCTLDEAFRIAELIGKSAAIPDVRSVGVALIKIMAGMEMGFGPFASLTGVDIVGGKPIVGANLKAAAIKRSDIYDYEIVEQDEEGEVCEVAFFERVAYTGGEHRKFTPGWKRVGTVRYTRELADQKGLSMGSKGVKDNWASSPADMLFARCITKGQKRFCPDISGGARTYDPDELDTVEPAAVLSSPPATRPVAVAHVPAPALEPAAVVEAEVVTGPEPETEAPAPNQTASPVMASETQVLRYGALIEQLRIDPEKARARLKEVYGTESPRGLTATQAQEAVVKLEALWNRRQEQAAPAPALAG